MSDKKGKVTVCISFCTWKSDALKAIVQCCSDLDEFSQKLDQTDDVGKGDSRDCNEGTQSEGSETQYDILISSSPGNLTPPEHYR